MLRRAGLSRIMLVQWRIDTKSGHDHVAVRQFEQRGAFLSYVQKVIEISLLADGDGLWIARGDE